MADIYTTIDGGTPEGGEQSLAGEMGAMLTLISTQLKDEFSLEWPPSKMLPYVNLAFQEIINLKPDAYPVERVVQLASGARQSVSATTTISVMAALCNMGTSGAVVGATITPLKKQTLDRLLPGWMTYADDQTVSHIVQDELSPLVFYVFPPQPASPSQIKLLVSEPVPEVTVDTTVFPLDASYKPAFTDYMLYRCLMEETEQQGANAKAVVFYNKFLQDLGMKATVAKQTGEK